MEESSNKNILLEKSTHSRASKKTKKASKHANKVLKLLTKLGINALNEPSKCVMVCNAGHGTGLQDTQLLQACLPYGTVEGVLMVPGMAYCFVVFTDVSAASSAYHALHGSTNPLFPTSRTLYLAYVETVTGYDSVYKFDTRPPGLFLYEDFVTETEEEVLLNCVDWTNTNSQSGKVLKQRRVKHYGYEFRYNINNVDKQCPLSEKIPGECDFLWPRLQQRGCDLVKHPPDQLTVNQYQPGNGIPQHVDTHSAFEDAILSLSLGATVVMELKHLDGRHVSVVLPRRSLLIMSGEARYAWSHGIAARKTDIMPSVGGGLMVQDRGTRTSFTFRHIRHGECECRYPEQCDSQQRQSAATLKCDNNDHVAAKLELHHVLKVYEEIADHFSETRHKPWPNVLTFVQSLPAGSVLLDVGCGNGKYFGHSSAIFQVGSDTSVNLNMVCRQRGYEVTTANCLHLPFVSGVADGCISIAVIHHLASQARRLKAVEEIVRVLRPGGKALIYVWSKDQQRGNHKSAYLKQNNRNNNTSSTADVDTRELNGGVTAVAEDDGLDVVRLPVHTNRTQFLHQDLFVPWIMKGSERVENSGTASMFYRYYHVFEEGELEKLCCQVKNCIVTNSYYDQGNWCIVIQKSCE